MKTVTLQSILLRAWQRAGNDASSIGNIPAGTQGMMLAAAQERLEQCWEWADWPDLVRVEERTLEGDNETGRYLPYAQSGETEMGTVFAVYTQNPDTHIAPATLQYEVRDGAVRFHDAPETVWVRFRLVPTTLAGLSTEVPAVLAKPVAYLLTSDLLEEDGQLDKALVMEQKAESELISERDKYLFQQGQTQRWSARMDY